jgi:hypothetical protein
MQIYENIKRRKYIAEKEREKKRRNPGTCNGPGPQLKRE